MRVGRRRLPVLGFTLIELLVTVAVFVVLATVAVPSYNSLIRNSSVASDYNKVLVGLSYARSEAVKRRKLVGVDVQVSVNGWQMEVLKGDDVLRVFASSRSGGVVTEGRVEFNSLGRVSSCDFGDGLECKIFVSSNSVVRGVEVLLSGRAVEVVNED